MSQQKPFFGTVERLIDRLPFLGEKRYIEIWEHTRYFMGFKVKTFQKEIIKNFRTEDLAASNSSFDFLHQQPGFLNILLNNISSCILLLNKENRLTAFNDNMKTIFSNKKDENLVYKRCGEAIGCAYQVEEQKDCGTTSMCDTCELRHAVLSTLASGESKYRQDVVRPFFNTAGIKVLKHLQFSTHLFNYHKDKYAIMIIEDTSRFFQKSEIN